MDDTNKVDDVVAETPVEVDEAGNPVVKPEEAEVTPEAPVTEEPTA